jgi:hypothetical protein
MARGKISVALAVPILFPFARLASFYYEELVCVCVCVCVCARVYIFISDGVEIVYKLQFLPSNIASETLLHKPGALRSVDWVFIIGAPAWRLRGE